MKGTRHSEEQIIAILKQGEAGLKYFPYFGCCKRRAGFYCHSTVTWQRHMGIGGSLSNFFQHSIFGQLYLWHVL